MTAVFISSFYLVRAFWPVILHAVWSAVGMILLSVCLSVYLWRCALWCSGSV